MCKKLLFLTSFIVMLALAGNAGAQLDPATINDGHVYLLEEIVGGQVSDDSANGNAGNIVGDPQLVGLNSTGAEGPKSLLFDGVDDGVDIPDSANINVTSGPWQNRTVIAMFRCDNVNKTTKQTIFEEGGYTRGMVFYVHDGLLYAAAWNRAEYDWDGAWLSTPIESDQWYGVAMIIRDGTDAVEDDKFEMWLDGELIATAPGGEIYNHANDNSIGYVNENAVFHDGNSNTNGHYFEGAIDEVWILNVALTEAELGAFAAKPWPFASSPEPADGGLVEATWANLAWSAGGLAASHDVYFGTSFQDVNAGAEGTFVGNVSEPVQIVGFPGLPIPEGLVPGTTYYWRVDEIDEANPDSPWQGDVWSFSVPPRTAYNPSPIDGTQFVDPNVTLSWTGGFEAKLHHVYFGDDFDEVSNAVGNPPIPEATFTPGTLELEKTYYWRVDEFDAAAVHKGGVWSFTTTLPGLGTAVMDRWEGIPGTGLDALKNDLRYPKNPDVTETVDSFSWNGEDLDDYGARIEGWLYAPVTGDYTFWINTDDNSELWLSTDDDPSSAVLIAEETGWAPFDEWRSDETMSAPVTLVGGEKYYIAALWKEGGGGDHCQVAWQGPGIPERTVIPGSNLSPFEPVKAFGATPANRAVDVSWTPTLRWRPGLQAESHEVYFGTDPNAVVDATKASPEFKGTRQLDDESYQPGTLELETTYYWRVDEINPANPESPWVGRVWSFTTADFGIVDNFESYNDIPAGEPGSNLVYVTWVDGFDNPNVNGSTMGYVTGQSMETENVHGGSQSVAFQYNNTTAGVSEVVRTFAPAQDWTMNDFQTLSLWFAGIGTNVPGQLYVKVNGVQVDYPGLSSDLALAGWRPWNIPLDSINANLSNVTSMTIGVQGGGATGTLLLDDIALYTQVAETITPVQPDPAGLVLHYAFEGNTNDSAGANQGTAFGSPTYVMGNVGQAIMLDGLDDYVAIDNFSYAEDGHTEITVSAWIRTALEDDQIIVAFDRNEYWRLEINGDGAGAGEVGWDVMTDTGQVDYGSNARVDDDQWHHVAGVFDNGKLTVYIDGYAQEPAFGGATFGTGTARFGYIGLGSESTEFNLDPRTPANYFTGAVDEVRIYERALTNGEVAGLAGRTQALDKPF